MAFVFLDEIQEIPGWEKWVRTMHELRKAKIVVSGSNANLLSKELGTLLTGRHLDLTVFPLSFKEFLEFKGLEVKTSLTRSANAFGLGVSCASILNLDLSPKSDCRNTRRKSCSVTMRTWSTRICCGASE